MSRTKVQKSNWCHVALTISNAGEAALYINGSLEAGPKNARGGQRVATGNDLIGISWDGGKLGDWFSTFRGSIDEVKVYGRVLSEQEINRLVGPGVVITGTQH